MEEAAQSENPGCGCRRQHCMFIYNIQTDFNLGDVPIQHSCSRVCAAVVGRYHRHKPKQIVELIMNACGIVVLRVMCGTQAKMSGASFFNMIGFSRLRRVGMVVK